MKYFGVFVMEKPNTDIFYSEEVFVPAINSIRSKISTKEIKVYKKVDGDPREVLSEDICGHVTSITINGKIMYSEAILDESIPFIPNWMIRPFGYGTTRKKEDGLRHVVTYQLLGFHFTLMTAEHEFLLKKHFKKQFK